MRRLTAFLAACLLPLLALATVPSETYSVEYAGNGVTTSFDIPFQFSSSASLRVATRNNSTGAVTEITTGFTVTGAGTDDGEIEFDDAPASGTTVVIAQAAEMLQETDYVPNDVFSAETHEAALDHLTRIAHRLDENIQRSIRVPFGDTNAGEDMELPSAPERAGRYLYFNETTGAPEPAEELEAGTTLSASVIGGYIYPESAAETVAGVTPSNLTKPYGHGERYGAVCDDSTDATAGMQSALDVVAVSRGEAIIPTGSGLCVVDTLTFDASNFTLRGEGKGAGLKASSNIPASGAVLLSLAGGSDATVNQALLDGIYGASVESVRTSVTGSLENVVFRDFEIEGNANAVRGIWATGFTRGSRIEGVYFNNLDGAGIALNGSWSFSLIANHFKGDGTNGDGATLGVTGNGERSGTSVVNAATIIANEFNAYGTGLEWDFGIGGAVSGNIFEGNAADGFESQSVEGLQVVGNYFEDNDGDNLDMGGTNGTDFAEGWFVSGNVFSNPTGNNIRMDGVKNSFLGFNEFSGAVTQHYFIPSAGGGANVLENQIYVPDDTSTYIANASELDTTDNFVIRTHSSEYRYSTPRITAVSELRTGSSSTLGLFGVTPVAQQADIGALTEVGTGNDVLQDVTGSHDQTILNNNFSDLAEQINELRTAIRNYGLLQ